MNHFYPYIQRLGAGCFQSLYGLHQAAFVARLELLLAHLYPFVGFVQIALLLAVFPEAQQVAVLSFQATPILHVQLGP